METDAGDWTDRAFADVIAEAPEAFAAFAAANADFAFPGGESFAQQEVRVSAALDDVEAGALPALGRLPRDGHPRRAGGARRRAAASTSSACPTPRSCRSDASGRASRPTSAAARRRSPASQSIRATPLTSSPATRKNSLCDPASEPLGRDCTRRFRRTPQPRSASSSPSSGVRTPACRASRYGCLHSDYPTPRLPASGGQALSAGSRSRCSRGRSAVSSDSTNSRPSAVAVRLPACTTRPSASTRPVASLIARM